MHVIVTGGAGFLGTQLIQRLLANDTTGIQVTSLDRVSCPIDSNQVESVVGDVGDAAALGQAFRADTAAVYHLAAIVSGEAEQNFDLGMKVNLDATRALLEVCRSRSAPVRFIFASSIAVFGPNMPTPLDHNTATQPRSSYGTQKAMSELLINDYSRRGFIDAMVCRLPTISVRPGRPNQATTSFASSIIREPLVGKTAVCPVDPALAMWLSSPETVITNLVHALKIDGQALGVYRTFNLPGITVSVKQMIEACQRAGGHDAVEKIEYKRDPAIEAIVASFPAVFDTAPEQHLGFIKDADFDDIVAKYLQTRLPA
ncbi:MAG: SDR family oxidoreductase [Salinisphaera sp.]|jgi:nucleoside-diphosphate-sugar epimerase|nr:SDR family oxidoreductase [Salinisphaera sp.]